MPETLYTFGLSLLICQGQGDHRAAKHSLWRLKRGVSTLPKSDDYTQVGRSDASWCLYWCTESYLLMLTPFLVFPGQMIVQTTPPD